MSGGELRLRRCTCEQSDVYGAGVSDVYPAKVYWAEDMSLRRRYSVGCPYCGAVTGWFRSEDEAVAEWNSMKEEKNG